MDDADPAVPLAQRDPLLRPRLGTIFAVAGRAVDLGSRPVSSLEPRDRELLESLSTGLRRILSTSVLGAYLHGSTGLGRLRLRSDLDVLVVNGTPLTAAERAEVTGLCLGLSGRYPRQPGGSRPIELTVVTASDVRPWRYPPQCDLVYGERLRADVEAGLVLASFPCPDLAILCTMVLGCDAALFGPSPAELVDPVPPGHLVRAAIHGLSSLLDDLHTDTTNVLLTLARAWCTCATGDVVPKDAAANWALAQANGPTDVLAHARQVYLGEQPEDWQPLAEQLRPAADLLVTNISRSAGAR